MTGISDSQGGFLTGMFQKLNAQQKVRVTQRAQMKLSMQIRKIEQQISMTSTRDTIMAARLQELKNMQSQLNSLSAQLDSAFPIKDMSSVDKSPVEYPDAQFDRDRENLEQEIDVTDVEISSLEDLIRSSMVELHFQD